MNKYLHADDTGVVVRGSGVVEKSEVYRIKKKSCSAYTHKILLYFLIHKV